MRASGEQKMTQPLSILTGISAGITEAFIVVSFELVKIRMQDKSNAGKYRDTLDCVRTILREEGPLAFFKGLEATIWRHAAWNGGYFGVIFGVRAALPTAETPQGNLLRNFVAGAVGGTVGTMLNTPFDVVKTRIQNQITARPLASDGVQAGPRPKYRGTMQALSLVAREEGLGALYKGFTPKVLRLGPGGGILLVVFEGVTTMMRRLFVD